MDQVEVRREQGEHPSEAKGFFVVGLGASAGGISALKQFFSGMPKDSGMAFVVVLHLSQEHESHLAEILQTTTAMKVSQVSETVKVEPNHVYVIPPAKHLAMLDGDIRLQEPQRVRGKRVPIDLFFRTLGEAYGKHAVAVVLSGTGSDGTLGIKRVKENGGIVLAQRPDEAEYDDMPRHAINTNVVDAVLPVAEMPRKIVAISRTAARLEPQVKAAETEEDTADLEDLTDIKDQNAETPEAKTETPPDVLREILTLLKVRTGHDFHNYKRPTLLRRIARRLQVHELSDIGDYLPLLRERPEEVEALLRDLLISVTNFFRDKEAFSALELEVVPRLFANKTANDTVRVWSCGCATGEEAYSLAMLLSEYASKQAEVPKIQIFASDINEDAIRVARDGRYDETLVADISPERLGRFFIKDGDLYRVKKEIRDLVLFAPHNVLRDPPFSKLDLITCRNLLIYLNRETQNKTLEIFHFALRPSGYLFLGSSETAEHPPFFGVLDKGQRIYHPRPGPNAYATVPTPPVSGEWEVKHPEVKRQTAASSYGDLHFRLVEHLAPPSLLIDENYRLLHVSEHAGHFLQVRGEVTQDLLKIIRPSLKLELQSALIEAQQKGVSEATDVRLQHDGKETLLNIIVHAISATEADRAFYLVIFHESQRAFTPFVEPEARAPASREAMEGVVRHLEADLSRTRDRLQTSVEQHETSVEELRASNEELQAMNEELRSASEELQTSKEELQSVNEELTTVNHELKDRVDEVSRTNADLQNLMASTDIGTMFLDRSLHIKLFTPPLRDLFNILPSDVGRPLSDLTHKLGYDDLLADAGEVLRTLRTLEREVSSRNGKHYLARLSPYRTSDDHINGVVAAFVDITRRSEAEAQVRESEERQRLLLESAKDFAIFALDTHRRVTTWNSGAEKIFGYSEQDILGQSADVLFTPEDRERGDPEREIETARRSGRAANERWHSRSDGSSFYGSGSVTPLLNEAGVLLGFVKIMRDLTEQKRMTEALQASEEALREADKRKDEFLAVLAHELRNPLAPIRTSLEIMKRTRDKEADEEARAIIERQVEHVVHLVDDLLDISRISRGTINLKKEWVELPEVITMAVESSAPLIEENRHELSVSLPQRSVTLEADKTRLSQVFLNLLNNAAKYTNPEGKISLTAILEGSHVVVRVKDTGQGIPSEQLPKLFELFTRLEPDVNQEGLGIGLNLVKQLVEMHGGTVEAFSAGLNQGSEFTVRLPVAQSDEAMSPKVVPKKISEVNPDQGERKVSARRVLVVDDYEPNRKTLGRLLRVMGHEVQTASSGEAGLESLKAFRADVILLDLNMPGLNGFETARRIRERPELQDVTLVALTGYGLADDVRRTKEAGFDAHLVKPVEAGVLEELLDITKVTD